MKTLGIVCLVPEVKTLPEAQRTQDIEFIIQIIFMAEIKQSNKQTNKQNNKQSNKTTNNQTKQQTNKKQDVLVYPIFIFAIFLKI